jgi:hypothetical protein
LFVWFACFLDFQKTIQKLFQLEIREGRAVFINYY